MLLITNINASFLRFGLILFAYLHLEIVRFNVWFQQNIFQSYWDSQMHEYMYFFVLCIRVEDAVIRYLNRKPVTGSDAPGSM